MPVITLPDGSQRPFDQKLGKRAPDQMLRIPPRFVPGSELLCQAFDLDNDFLAKASEFEYG